MHTEGYQLAVHTEGYQLAVHTEGYQLAVHTEGYQLAVHTEGYQLLCCNISMSDEVYLYKAVIGMSGVMATFLLREMEK